MQKQWLKIIAAFLILMLCLPLLTAAQARHHKKQALISHKTTAKKSLHKKKTPIKKKPAKKKIIKKNVVKSSVPKLVVAFKHKMVVTAFLPQHSDGRRRHIGNGNYACKGSVAVSYRQISKGSKMYIEGYGWGCAVSTGGAMKKDRIDVCLPTSKEARQWGRRTVWVTVYKIK